MFKRFIEDTKMAAKNPIPYATKLSVNAVAIVVGYRLWTNKPLTTFDKITFTIGLCGISFLAFLMFDYDGTNRRKMGLRGGY